jgi:hypothetical protein
VEYPEPVKEERMKSWYNLGSAMIKKPLPKIPATWDMTIESGCQLGAEGAISKKRRASNPERNTGPTTRAQGEVVLLLQA